jgi:hypothetical protein
VCEETASTVRGEESQRGKNRRQRCRKPSSELRTVNQPGAASQAVSAGEYPARKDAREHPNTQATLSPPPSLKKTEFHKSTKRVY